MTTKEMPSRLIEKCKGEYVTKKPNSKKVWEVMGYCRTNRAYELVNIEDINDFAYLKKGTIVYLSDCN